MNSYKEMKVMRRIAEELKHQSIGSLRQRIENAEQLKMLQH
jgi:hypothetical protein